LLCAFLLLSQAFAQTSSDAPSYWPDLSDEILSALVSERKEEIATIKEAWRPFIATMASDHVWQERTEEFNRCLSEGTIVSSSEGDGGAYFLYDNNHRPRYVIKPFDEDGLCVNNRKGKASPYRDDTHRVRDAIPLYESFQRELAASHTASLLHIELATPWTIVAIVASDVFFDVGIGNPDKEKLCSVQPFISETIGIGEAVHEWFEAGFETLGIPLPLDQDSFEQVNLLLWATNDCDGHGSNFLLTLHSLEPTYRLIKIDNGLCFPTRNTYLLNYLAYLPNAKVPLSMAIREKIENISTQSILSMLAALGLHDSLDATASRLRVLKALALRPEMTIEEMNHRMELLALPKGEQLALMQCTREELEQLEFEN